MILRLLLSIVAGNFGLVFNTSVRESVFMVLLTFNSTPILTSIVLISVIWEVILQTGVRHSQKADVILCDDTMAIEPYMIFPI